MVKTPKTRHSKPQRDPVTIDLDPADVSRVEAESFTTEGDEAAVAPEEAVIDEAVEAPASTDAASAAPVDDVSAAVAEEPAVKPEEPKPEARGYGFADETTKPSQSRPERPAAPPPAKRGGLSAVAAGLIGGAVALLGGAGLQYAGLLGTPGTAAGDPAAVASLQGELEALKQEVAGLKVVGDDALSASLDQVKADLAALKSAVEQGGAGDGAAVAALDAKLKEIEAVVANIGQGGGDAAGVAALGEKIAAVEGQVKAATDAAASVDGRIATLEQSVTTLAARVDAQAAQPKVALAIATAALKQALERDAPFVAELETFAAIAPDAPELAALRAHAEKGVSTRASLIEDMPAAANAMIAAADPVDQDAGFFARLLDSAESLVSVRPIGEVAGEGAPETVARMEVAVNQGDLAKAVAEYETLPDAAKAAGAAYADRIKARLDVETLVDRAIAGAMKA